MTLNELKEKDPGIWLKAIANAHNQNRIVVEGSNNISASFSFELSKEGYDYWNNIRHEKITFNPNEELYAKFYWTFSKAWVYVKINIRSSIYNYLSASLYKVVNRTPNTGGTFNWKEVENFELIDKTTFDGIYNADNFTEELIPTTSTPAEFKVGDRVECIKAFDVVKEGVCGVIVDIEKDNPPFGVAWDINVSGHSCGGKANYGYGYYVYSYNIKLIESEKEIEWLDRCITEGKYIDKESTTEKNILLEAKRKYPIGTKFYPAHMGTSDNSSYCIVTDDSEFVLEGGCILAKINGNNWNKTNNPKYGNTSYNRFLYYNYKWATILPNDEFVLPNKWCVKSTDESDKALIKYRGGGYTNRPAYMCSDKIWRDDRHAIHNGYTEITYEQFKQYVLKEPIETMKPKYYEDLSQHIGRYIEALVNYPSGGKVIKGEVGIIISKSKIDFPSQSGYVCVNALAESHKDRYKLLPESYKPEDMLDKQWRIKTKLEFVLEGLWDIDKDVCTSNWVSKMNKYLGCDIPIMYHNVCNTEGGFIWNGWTWNPHMYTDKPNPIVVNPKPKPVDGYFIPNIGDIIDSKNGKVLIYGYTTTKCIIGLYLTGSEMGACHNSDGYKDVFRGKYYNCSWHFDLDNPMFKLLSGTATNTTGALGVITTYPMLPEASYFGGYKVGDIVTIPRNPRQWASLLNSNCPLSQDIYPYTAQIKQIQVDEGYVAAEIGEYGWSLSDLIEDTNIYLFAQDNPINGILPTIVESYPEPELEPLAQPKIKYFKTKSI